MTAVAFDTLKLARKLRDTAQMSQAQAEGVADALAEAMSGAELATKGDVVAAKAELKADLAEVKAELKADLAEVKADLKADLKAEVAAVRADMAEVKHHLEAKISGVKADVCRLEERIERRAAESDIKAQTIKNEMIRWLLGIGAAAMVTIIGAAWTIIRSLPAHP
jgi:hypothetical protein